jgi:hypothetical protein
MIIFEQIIMRLNRKISAHENSLIVSELEKYVLEYISNVFSIEAFLKDFFNRKGRKEYSQRTQRNLLQYFNSAYFAKSSVFLAVNLFSLKEFRENVI